VKKGNYSLYWQYLRKYSLSYKVHFFLMFLFLMAGTFLQIPVPLLFKKIVDDILPQKNILSLVNIGALVIVIVVFREFFTYLSRLTARRLKNNMYYTLSMELFEGFFNIPYLKIKEKGPAYFASRIFEEPRNLEDSLTESVVFIGKMFFIFLFGLIACLHISWRLTLIILAFVPVYYLINGLFSPYIRKISIKLEEVKARFREYTVGLLSAYKPILILNNALLLSVGSVSEKLKEFLGIRYKYDKASSFYSALYSIFGDGMPVVVFFVGIYEIIHGRLTIGGLIAFTQLMGYVSMPLQHFSDILLEVETTIAHIMRIEEFKNMICKNKKGLSEINSLKSIKLDSISVGFEDKKVIDNLSFLFEKGKGYIVKGDNGSGKSTLLDVISGFITPSSGKVIINERYDLSVLNREAYRRKLSVSFFPPVLLPVNDENLQMIKEPSLEKIAQSILKDKSGYRFTQLSSGEKQKLNILLALSKDADFYIFDEPFSNMDRNSVEFFKKLIIERTINQKKGLIMVLHEDYNLENEKDFETLYLEKIKTQEV